MFGRLFAAVRQQLDIRIGPCWRVRHRLQSRLFLVRHIQLIPVCSLFLLLLLLNALPAVGGAAGEHTLRSTRTLGSGREAPLYSVSGISADRRNNVYVTDVLDYSVKKFNPGGALVGKVGRRGTGPGEFRNPALSLVVQEKLLVLQTGVNRIQVFDTALSYLGGFTVKGGMPVDIAPIEPGGMAIALYSDTSAAALLLYHSPDDRAPRRVRLEPTGKRHPLYGAVRLAVCRDGLLVVAYLFLNRVELYSSQGRFLRRFSVATLGGEGEGFDDGHVPEETFFRKVVVDDFGKILLLGGNRGPHPGRDLFVCSRKGRLLRTFVLPFRTRVIARGENNTLYATDEGGTRVERYDIR